MTAEKSGSRWWFMSGFALVAFFGVYYLAVRTYLGQYVENAALGGAKQVAKPELMDSLENLHTISMTSLAIVIGLVGIVGLIRRSWRIAFASTGTIAVSVLLTEALKKIILTRPNLAPLPIEGDNAHNSFPSGHTTIAMAIIIALLLVTAYRWRGPVMFFSLAWGVSMGAATITAGWHRFSDTLGADLVVLFVAGLATVWLARGGVLEAEPKGLYPLRTVLVAVFAGLATLSLAAGAVILVRSLQIWDVLPQLNAARQAGVAPDLTAHMDPTFQMNMYLASQSLALAFSILSVLWFWGTFHRLSTASPQGKHRLR